MCGYAAAAAIVITLLAGAYTADAQKKAGEAQEEQSQENAKAAEASGRNTTLSAQVAEDRRRQQTRAMLASQRATLASNNVDMSTGTPMEILGDTAAIGEQDALTIRANAAREAWGYSVESNNYMNQGRMAKAAGQNSATATYLTTAASAFSMGSGSGGMSGGGMGGGNTIGSSRGSTSKSPYSASPGKYTRG